MRQSLSSSSNYMKQEWYKFNTFHRSNNVYKNILWNYGFKYELSIYQTMNYEFKICYIFVKYEPFFVPWRLGTKIETKGYRSFTCLRNKGCYPLNIHNLFPSTEPNTYIWGCCYLYKKTKNTLKCRWFSPM